MNRSVTCFTANRNSNHSKLFFERNFSALSLLVMLELTSKQIQFVSQLVTKKDKLFLIHWPILGIFGGKDTNIIIMESVNKFESILDELGIENEIYVI